MKSNPMSQLFVSSAIVFLLSFPAIAQESKGNAESKGVSISYTSLVSYMQVQDKNGNWGPPAERANFAEDYGKRFIVTARAQGRSLECPVVWQDVAYFLDDKGKRGRRIAIFGYRGCPFSVEDELEVVKNIEMREETKIEIERATDNILWVSSMSTRPLASTGGGLAQSCEMLVNMVWLFKSKGTNFTTKEFIYAAEKDGATIKFTKDGVVFDGVKKTEKKQR